MTESSDIKRWRPKVKTLYLRIMGYKSIRGMTKMKIKPLTLIGGSNSSGKSSFMQGLLLVKQTIEAQFDPGPLLMNGPNVALTSVEQMFSRGRSKNDAAKMFSVGAHINGISVDLQFTKVKSGLHLKNMRLKRREEVNLHQGMSADIEFLREAPGSRFKRYEKLIDEASAKSSIKRNRCFLEASVKVDSFEFPIPNYAVNTFRRLAVDTIHVPGLRGNPERVYPSSAVGTAFPGKFEKYVASLIDSWQNGSTEDKAKLSALNRDLESLGLTWKIMSKPVNDISVELLVGRLPHAQQGGAHDLVNIADVGFGVSQTLPVLVSLIAADAGQIVYIEQPEIHLHPRAQSALSKVLVRHAKRGVRVIVETHSPLIIKGVQSSLAHKEVDPEDVALHWFTRSSEDGCTSLKTANVDEFGRFGDWPIDFDEVVMNSEMEYLDAVEDRMQEEGF
ncbi:DUF3696 domain-containing protein [Nocardiopsis sp. NRRL B-16309]|uniref:AAA family ATPase n=1 Tax=Nocardiopsis sp. NRRL B-16309 TaxID=1519494 RepID=UPI0009E6E31F|nr:DUF3696 domain-containing protein [Nocardiopsis sp. NRRL B-16309]